MEKLLAFQRQLYASFTMEKIATVAEITTCMIMVFQIQQAREVLSKPYKNLQNLFECEYTTTVIHWFDIHVAPFATK